MRVEILAGTVHGDDLCQQRIKVAGVARQIDLCGVDDQQRRIGVRLGTRNGITGRGADGLAPVHDGLTGGGQGGYG